jgi:hypothetical protein
MILADAWLLEDQEQEEPENPTSASEPMEN